MKDILKDSNMRWTHQRQSVYEEALGTKGHFTAEGIYRSLAERNINVGLSTVYRTLQLLVDKQILTQLPTDGETSVYECSDDSLHGHHHVKCIRCGKTIEIHMDRLEIIEKFIKREHDFEIISHTVIFNGICADCRNELSRSKEEESCKE